MGAAYSGPATEAMALSQIGYYRIDRLLGAGGMGAVYEATHQMTGRHVALKTLRSELADRPDLNARFFNEARTMSFLEHPGIVRVFDVGRTDDGTAYMVMELCVGPTLGAAMRELLGLPARIALLAPVADALAYAHTQGVIHRDLKPDNVIITAGPHGPCPKVLDFGIAKVLEGASAAGSPFSVKTRTGTAMGTPLYMSPEQCRGMGGITRATDVYSLGIMLYEALSGRVPFNGGVGEVIVQHLTTPVPMLEDETVVDTRAPVKALVYAMLEKAAEARPDMAEVARVLNAYIGEPHPDSIVPLAPRSPPTALAPHTLAAAPTLAAPVEVPPPAPAAQETQPPPASRSRVPVVLAGVVVLCAVVGGVVLVSMKHRPPPAVVAPRPPERPPAPRPERPPTPPPPATDPQASLHWRVESTPVGADVFGPDGVLLGVTPYTADAVLARGTRSLYVRKLGYRDELVSYDASGVSLARLKSRARPRLPRQDSKQDDFDVQPVN